MLNAMRSLLKQDVLLCCTPTEVPYTERPDYYAQSKDANRDAAHAMDLWEAEGSPAVMSLHKSVVYLARPNITLGLFTSMDKRIPRVAVAVAGQGITHTSLHLASVEVEEKEVTWMEAALQDYAVRARGDDVEWFVPLSAIEGITTQS